MGLLRRIRRNRKMQGDLYEWSVLAVVYSMVWFGRKDMCKNISYRVGRSRNVQPNPKSVRDGLLRRH